MQDHFYDNPGGHAVVWAEENSRDALFDAVLAEDLSVAERWIFSSNTHFEVRKCGRP